jgi:hypothetical protein
MAPKKQGSKKNLYKIKTRPFPKTRADPEGQALESLLGGILSKKSDYPIRTIFFKIFLENSYMAGVLGGPEVLVVPGDLGYLEGKQG